MRGLLRISFFAATILSPVYAQNAPSPAPLPPAMQSAIDRLAKGGSAIEEHTVVLQNRPGANICSVPLVELRIDHPEQFSMRTAPPATTADPMPHTQGPAPPCDQTGR
jgi:hypothetical protein